MKRINDALMTTLAACGDVNRSVVNSSTPVTESWMEGVHADSQCLSDALLPTTPSYNAIWVEGVQLNLADHQSHDDPLYGKTYLPRKFKTAFAVPPLNDVDLFTNCLGFIAIEEEGKLIGYNLTTGWTGNESQQSQHLPQKSRCHRFSQAGPGGSCCQGRSDGSSRFRRSCRPQACTLEIRSRRKGVAWFRQELEESTQFALEDPDLIDSRASGDRFGWHQQVDGRSFLGLFVETGRIKDTDEIRLRVLCA